MARGQLRVLLQHIRTVIGTPNADRVSDEQLLERFTAGQDSVAFDALLQRYGPMVLGVCRRVLAHEQDAEDAFQATFLVFVRKAASIRKRQSVGSWLYGVAYRIGVKARALASRRAVHEKQAPKRRAADPLSEVVWRDLRLVLDDELNRLPEKYRCPVILCYLQGKTNEEAAKELSWPTGTVKIRLARARALLQTRLARRGCTLGATAFAVMFEQSAAPAVVPAALADSSAKIATLLVANGIVEAGGLSGQVASLAEGMLRTIFLAKMKLATEVLLAATVLAAGAGFVVRQAVAGKQGTEVVQLAPRASQPAQAKAEEKQPTRTDAFGDPLPAGAVARLGSLQLRHHGLSDLVFSADGKTLVSTGADRAVRFWDAATGKLVRTTKLQGTAGPGSCVTLSPDARTIVCWDNGTLYFWDVESGKEIKRLPGPESRHSLNHLYFSPDGQTLAVSFDVLKVTLWNWKEGTHRQLNLPTRRKIIIGADSTCHGCFSPDGKLLATGSAWQDPLCIWDAATGNELRRIDAQAGVSAFSPDSKLLAAASMGTGGNQDDTVLRLYEVATGKEVLHVPLPGKGFYWYIAFSPDGKAIVPVDTEGIYLLDIRTGQEICRLAGKRVGRQRTVLFSPDGRLLAARGTNRIRIWDVATGKELHERPGNGEEAYGVAYSPDGRLLATGAWSDATIGLWDTATGRRLGLLELERKTGSVRQLFFSADGKLVVIGSAEGFVEFWDAATYRVQRSLSLNDARQPAQQYPNFHAFHLSPDERRLISLEKGSQVCIWETQPAKLVASHEVARAPRNGWAPLGNKAAVLTDDGIVVADGTTGMIYPRVPGTWEAPLAASPDARLLAARLKQALRPLERSEQQREAEGIRVWEAATGQEVVTLTTGTVDFLSLTPDTRKIITVDGRSLRVWDLATGKELHRRDFPEEFAASFHFVRGLFLSPDGRRATTALADGTLLVWEIPPLSRPLAVDTKGPDAQEATSWWSELASADAAKAYAAVWKLIDARDRSVAVLRKNLTPAAAEDFRKAEQLLRDLDSDVFSVRQAAAKELEKMGSAVAPVLRQVLAANPSPEVRRRLETLLEKCSRGIPSAEVLRRLRCVLVLERIGSPEARQVLQSMADGAPAALETQEARTALERLAKPPK